FAAAVGERDLVSAQLEELAQALRGIVIVFDHQDAQVLARLERGKLGYGRRPVLQLLQAPAEVAERVENLELQRVDAAQRSGFHAQVAIGIEKKPCHVLDAADHHPGIEVVHCADGARAQAGDVLQGSRVVAATGSRDHGVHQRGVKAKSFVQLAFWHVVHRPAIRGNKPCYASGAEETSCEKLFACSWMNYDRLGQLLKKVFRLHRLDEVQLESGFA